VVLDFYNKKLLKMEEENQLFFNTCLAFNISPENALGLLRCDENVANEINPLVLLTMILGIIVNNGEYVCREQILFLTTICDKKLSNAERMSVFAEFEKVYAGNEYIVKLRKMIDEKQKEKEKKEVIEC
jgi:hypothetical protein